MCFASKVFTFATQARGSKQYELTDHLGNIRTVVPDIKEQPETADVANAGTLFGTLLPLNYLTDNDNFRLPTLTLNNYYPYGMLQAGRTRNAGGYRFGFQGQEADNKIGGLGQRTILSKQNFKMLKYILLTIFLIGTFYACSDKIPTNVIQNANKNASLKSSENPQKSYLKKEIYVDGKVQIVEYYDMLTNKGSLIKDYFSGYVYDYRSDSVAYRYSKQQTGTKIDTIETQESYSFSGILLFPHPFDNNYDSLLLRKGGTLSKKDTTMEYEKGSDRTVKEGNVELQYTNSKIKESWYDNSILNFVFINEYDIKNNLVLKKLVAYPYMQNIGQTPPSINGNEEGLWMRRDIGRNALPDEILYQYKFSGDTIIVTETTILDKQKNRKLKNEVYADWNLISKKVYYYDKHYLVKIETYAMEESNSTPIKQVQCNNLIEITECRYTLLPAMPIKIEDL